MLTLICHSDTSATADLEIHIPMETRVKMAFQQRTVVGMVYEYWIVLLVAVVLFIGMPLFVWMWRSCRHYSRYDYTALEDEQSLQEKLELEKKVKRTLARGLGCFSLGGTKDAKHCTSRSESAFLTCQYYLKNSGRYILLEQLGDIGSRLDKFWFLVRDTTLKTERLLTMIPQSPFSPVQFSGSTKKMLMELFLSLQHPYIYPVLDIDVKMLAEEEYVMVILPFNIKGSLKDIIYKSRCQDEWQDKYHNPNAGLPIPQIQRLGRQILEALLFLEEKGFPPFGHLHSGNVIVQNGVSRLTGFENTLLGYTSRLYPTIKKKLKNSIQAMDVVCFGHVLFEMCAGYELSMAHPTARHFEEIQQYPEVVEVLSYIFEQDDGHYPTVKELTVLEFFRNMDLREMRSMPAPTMFQVRFSPLISNLLNDVRKHQTSHRYLQDELNCDKQKSSSENDDDTCKGRDDSGFNHAYSDGDGNDGDDDDDDTKAEIHSSSDDIISTDYFEQSIIMTKRFRSSSLFENRFRQSASLADQKSARLKKRRSNSASQMADCLENATTALLSCPSSESSLAPSTPYASLADMHTHHTLISTPSDEFHTPPNTPIVSKTLESDPLLMSMMPASKSEPQSLPSQDDTQFHVTINHSDFSKDDSPV